MIKDHPIICMRSLIVHRYEDYSYKPTYIILLNKFNIFTGSCTINYLYKTVAYNDW